MGQVRRRPPAAPEIIESVVEQGKSQRERRVKLIGQVAHRHLEAPGVGF
jgi:hypothetical protein